MKFKNNHNWKSIPITVQKNGIEIRAIIHYWAKDYYLEITYPIHKKLAGYHLQLAVPVIYVTDEAPRKGIHYINLLERCKDELLNYEESLC